MAATADAQVLTEANVPELTAVIRVESAADLRHGLIQAARTISAQAVASIEARRLRRGWGDGAD